MAEPVTIPGETIPELVEHWGSIESETPAFVSIHADGSRRTLSRKEVLDCSKRFAYKLRSIGVKSGDIVCNTLPNSLERVVCEFGIQFAGAASLNGQILRSDGVDFFESLTLTNCRHVIIDTEMQTGNIKFLYERDPHGGFVFRPELQDKQIIRCCRNDVGSENDFITTMKHDLAVYSAKVSPDDLATIMTTSGSTGYSKLVKHSQANLCHFCKQVKAIQPLSSGSRFLNCGQLGWAGGYPQWYLSCGVTRYFIDMRSGITADVPTLMWSFIVQEKIDYAFMSPLYANAVLTKCPWQQAKWRLKVLCLAGQPVKKEIMGIIGKLCDAVDVNYGMTECNVVTTHRIVEPGHYTDDCAGYPAYGVQLKIVDAHGEVVPSGTRGEIMVRSPSLFLGYVKNELEAASPFTEDGWFCTDDGGYVGNDGKIYIEGRRSDSIHRGVYILYPGWLEKAMKERCQIHNIVIVAVPDPVLHHEICACVEVIGLKGVVAGKLHRTDNTSDTRESLTASFSQHQSVSSNLITANPSQNEPVSPSLITASPSLHEPASSSLITLNPSQHEPVSSRQSKREPDKRTSPVENHASQSNFPHENYAESVLPKVEKESSVDNELKDTCGFLVESDQDMVSLVKTLEIKEGLYLNLLGLETELRQVADEVNALPENDTMRMVPRYYVFMGALPLTYSGKVSRKALRATAKSALRL